MPVLKSILTAPLRTAFRLSRSTSERVRRLVSHASLAAHLESPLPSSTVVLGRVLVYGTGKVFFGQNILLYPDLHFETHGQGSITLGESVVISRNVNIVAMEGVSIGAGSMIGEFSSIRDANHIREIGVPLRESGHRASAITVGREVWIGRGVAILAGVTIGYNATIGANAVVTHSVPAHAGGAGVPARPLTTS